MIIDAGMIAGRLIAYRRKKMAHDDIPEDDYQGFPCNCGGEIKKNEDGYWECDTCDFRKEV